MKFTLAWKQKQDSYELGIIRFPSAAVTSLVKTVKAEKEFFADRTQLANARYRLWKDFRPISVASRLYKGRNMSRLIQPLFCLLIALDSFPSLVEGQVGVETSPETIALPGQSVDLFVRVFFSGALPHLNVKFSRFTIPEGAPAMFPSDIRTSINDGANTMTSRLFINNIAVSHEGVYQIILADRANSARIIASGNVTLRIAVAPVANAENTVTVNETENAVVTCSSTGFPTPNVTIRFQDAVVAKGDGNAHFTIHNTSRSQMRSLILCEAKNMAGQSTRSTTILVQYKPRIQPVTGSPAVVVHGNMLLSCASQGFPTAQITWQHNGTDVSSQTAGVQISRMEFTNELFISVLNISNVKDSDAGRYTCTSRNFLGTAEKSADVKVIYKPGPPSKPSKVFQTADTIVVAARRPSDGGSVLLQYEISYRQDNNLTWTSNNVVPNGTVSQVFQIFGLDPWRNHTIRLRARNAAGWGAYSEDTVITTRPSFPPSPDIPTVTSTSPTTINITWELSNWRREHGAIKEFQVKYFEAGSTSEMTLTTSERSAVLMNLKKGTEYFFSVRAGNYYEKGPYSEKEGATTNITAPGKFLFVSATALSHEKVLVKWSNLSDTGGSPITKIHVAWKELSKSALHWTRNLGDQLSTTDSEFIVRGLSELTLYHFRISVFNKVGEGRPAAWTQPVMTLTFQFPPDVVNVTVGDVLPDRVSLTWSLSGSLSPTVPLNGFESHLVKVGAPATARRFSTADPVDKIYSFEMAGLDHNTNYTLELVASNEYAVSRLPYMVSFFTPNGSAPNPMNISIKSVDHQSAEILFELPESKWPLENLEVLISERRSTKPEKRLWTKFMQSVMVEDLKHETEYIAWLYVWTVYAPSPLPGEVVFTTMPRPTPPTVSSAATQKFSTSINNSEKDDKTKLIIIIIPVVVGVVVILVILLLEIVPIVKVYGQHKQERQDEPVPRSSGNPHVFKAAPSPPSVSEMRGGDVPTDVNQPDDAGGQAARHYDEGGHSGQNTLSRHKDTLPDNVDNEGTAISTTFESFDERPKEQASQQKQPNSASSSTNTLA